jgi:hypothetical protein
MLLGEYASGNYSMAISTNLVKVLQVIIITNTTHYTNYWSYVSWLHILIFLGDC